MWYWENVKADLFRGEKIMRDKIIDLQSVQEENNLLDTYVQGYFGGADREIDLFHYKLRKLDHPGHYAGADHCGDDSEPLDFGK